MPEQTRGGKREGAGRTLGATGAATRGEVLKLRASEAEIARIDALARPGETRSDVLRAGLVALATLRGRT